MLADIISDIILVLVLSLNVPNVSMSEEAQSLAKWADEPMGV